MAKKAIVDQDSCISCGLCVSVCPEAFRFNASKKSECFNQDGVAEQNIQQAIDGCPVQCISWQ